MQMPSFTARRVIAVGLAGTMAVAIPAALGSSNAQPANKAVASGSTVQGVHPGAGTAIMTASIKTSKPEDLLLSVSLECSIMTDVRNAGTAPSTDPNAPSSSNAEASGAIRVWLTMDTDDNIIPITDASEPPQDPSQQRKGTDDDKVTFCDRDHFVNITDAENPQDGTDAMRNYQLTKSANAFNWVRLNAGSGDHVIKVWAEFDQPAHDAMGPNSGAGSTSDGYVGNRTLVIEPTKLANNAVIS